MPAPSVSICVPTYDGASFMGECLESALAQTHGEFELLVVDDGSTDATLEIAEGFARRDPRVRVHRNPANLGLVGNWNRCARLARGEWIKFLFQDDLLLPECVASLVAAARPGVPIVVGRRAFLFAEGSSAETIAIYQGHATLDRLRPGCEILTGPEVAALALEQPGNFIGEPTSVLLHRTVFERFGPFSAQFVSFCDLEYWLRIGVNTGLCYVPRTLSRFRVHDASESARNRADREFRTQHIDRLLLSLEFVTNRHFAPVREAARRARPRRHLWRELARDCAEAKRVLARLASEEAPGAQAALASWRDAVRAHPLLEWNPWTWPGRARSWMDRHVLWRFGTRDRRARTRGTR